MKAPFIRMHSGVDVVLGRPAPDMIHLRDIAHHLSLINRFNGATETPYSVAQHSVLVADLLFAKRCAPHVVMGGLLHDAHEAYLGDTATPVKELLFGTIASNLDHAAHVFDGVIHRRFNLVLDAADQREIKLADLTALVTEWRDLMPGPCPLATKPSPHRVKALPWHRAEDLFVKTYNTFARHLNLQEF
jgi:uncharacterized protein